MLLTFVKLNSAICNGYDHLVDVTVMACLPICTQRVRNSPRSYHSVLPVSGSLRMKWSAE